MSDAHLRREMAVHYSQPKGFVGRSIIYAISANGVRYGSCVAGSAVYYLTIRDRYFGVSTKNLKNIINNNFFHIEKVDGRYPCRNFASRVLAVFRNRAAVDWEKKYGDKVLGFESLVELPRTGECYLRDGWQEIGVTKGFSCKRTNEESDISTDIWTGRRIWDTSSLRPKRIFVRRTVE